MKSKSTGKQGAPGQKSKVLHVGWNYETIIGIL